MYINKIEKHTNFVKVISKTNTGQPVYYVDEIIENGYLTLRSTLDPLKATLFTTKEVMIATYNNMSNYEKEAFINTHKQKGSAYDCLLAQATQFKVLTSETIEYGYSEDVQWEAQLIKELDLDYLLRKPQIKDSETGEKVGNDE